MVLRKVYDTVNKVGGTWLNLNQGFYSNPAKGAARSAEQARALLEEVVADWPTGVPETPAVRAARDYLARSDAQGTAD